MASLAGQTETHLPQLDRVLDGARQLLEVDKLDEAIAQLEPLAEQNGSAAAMLGAAHFRAERYARAAECLKRARELGVDDGRWLALEQRAEANARTDVARAVPEPLELAQLGLPRTPEPGAEHSGRARRGLPFGLRNKLVGRLGNALGLKLGVAIGALTRRFGAEPEGDSPWTTWYRHDFLESMLMLAWRRDRLNRAQIFSAYPLGTPTGFHRAVGPRPVGAEFARTADGSHTDLSDPLAGAAYTRFGFNTAPEATLGETGERLLTPNPRTVSRQLLARDNGFLPIPFLNLLAAPWIQFMNHDWVSYGDPADAEPYRIPLEADDPVRQTLHQTHMLVRPTQADPTRVEGQKVTTHLNEVTSWWDGSQIYGSDWATQQSLRSFHAGKLRVEPNSGNLPVLPDGVELTGFRRNWWLGLSMLHTLFVKEHNAICDMLAVHYPGFDDQRLFDTARLINAAVMAKIHTVEWTPAVLPNPALNAAMNSNWYGFLTNLLRAKNNRKTVAKINVADPIAGGLVGNATETHGVPYSLTREFLAVYRLHSLLPDHVDLFDIDAPKEVVRRLSLAETRQAAAHLLVAEHPMEDLF